SEETAGIVSINLIQNGDWTYQTLVMLEMILHSRNVYTYSVDHASAQSFIKAQSESTQSKLLSGIGGFVLELIFHLKNQKAETFCPY
ncbi:SLA class II histocompatibility antigen, DQ haplotype D beta chain-like, partial [Sarcophilus harrisii]